MGTYAAATARIRLVALTACLATIAALLAAGCGGATQDAKLSNGTWEIAVERWQFPTRQPLGTPVDMKLVIHNIDSRAIPELAVTIGGLAEPVDQQNAGSRARPVWLINELRNGDQTPYNALTKRTYNLGPLAAGRIKTFTLPLTPLRRGPHVVSYSIAPNIYGAGKAETANGGPVAGTRLVAIDPTPNINESVFK